MSTFNFKEYVAKINPVDSCIHRVNIEVTNCGILARFKVRPIKALPGLLGVARDRDTKGCITLRFVEGYGDDIAVYPTLTMREVIASFKSGDGVAAADAIYKRTLKEAEACLRSFL